MDLYKSSFLTFARPSSTSVPFRVICTELQLARQDTHIKNNAQFDGVIYFILQTHSLHQQTTPPPPMCNNVSNLENIYK